MIYKFNYMSNSAESFDLTIKDKDLSKDISVRVGGDNKYEFGLVPNKTLIFDNFKQYSRFMTKDKKCNVIDKTVDLTGMNKMYSVNKLPKKVLYRNKNISKVDIYSYNDAFVYLINHD